MYISGVAWYFSQVVQKINPSCRSFNCPYSSCPCSSCLCLSCFYSVCPCSSCLYSSCPYSSCFYSSYLCLRCPCSSCFYSSCLCLALFSFFVYNSLWNDTLACTVLENIQVSLLTATYWFCGNSAGNWCSWAKFQVFKIFAGHSFSFSDI